MNIGAVIGRKPSMMIWTGITSVGPRAGCCCGITMTVFSFTGFSDRSTTVTLISSPVIVLSVARFLILPQIDIWIVPIAVGDCEVLSSSFSTSTRLLIASNSGPSRRAPSMVCCWYSFVVGRVKRKAMIPATTNIPITATIQKAPREPFSGFLLKFSKDSIAVLLDAGYAKKFPVIRSTLLPISRL